MWLTKIKLAIAIATLMICSCSDKLPTEVVPGETSVYHGITLISIPGGSYQRGSDAEEDTRPVRTITISSFEMGVYEITNALYAAYLNESLASGDIKFNDNHDGILGASGDYNNMPYLNFIYDFPPSWSSLNPINRSWITFAGGHFSVPEDKANWPVVYVSWYGAMAFAEHYGLDLPTEAEWEYVCRGGRQYDYGTNDGTISSEKVNFYSDSPKDVGSYPANPFGIHDMSGNVMEWCKDWYGSSYYAASLNQDPQGPVEGTGRVLRGGGWYGYVNSYHRHGGSPGYLNYAAVGFRVVQRQ